MGKKKSIYIYKLIKLYFFEEEDNNSFLENNIGIGVNNNNGNYIPPHFRWYIMNRLGRNFIHYLNTFENVDTSDNSFYLFMFGAISIITLTYIFIKINEEDITDSQPESTINSEFPIDKD